MGCTSDSGTAFAAPTRAWARFALAGAALALVGGSPVGRLDVDIGKLRSSKGSLRICLTADPANFPSCVDDARALSRSIPASARSVSFEGLAVGDYAIAVIHDENANRKLDTVLGIPREGFGFSRNPAVGFGPPRFSAARFSLGSEGSEQDIRIRYLL